VIFFATGAGKTGTEGYYLGRRRRSTERGFASVDDAVQGGGKSDAGRIGRLPLCASDDFAGFIHHDTLGFAAAAIEPERDSHISSLREKVSFSNDRPTYFLTRIVVTSILGVSRFIAVHRQGRAEKIHLAQIAEWKAVGCATRDADSSG
jgi:hypothetical protein